jgi:hydrogenase expression/formation protein HypD
MFGAISAPTEDYRDEKTLERLVRKIAASMTRPWTIMEVCGDQTQTLLEYKLLERLPNKLSIVHGPGCAVATVPVEILDRALDIAQNPEVIFCAPVELLRIPGSTCDLLEVKARGSDVRVVYSPIDCINVARSNPGKKVVFFNVGYETAVQMDALAVWQARRLGITNFFLLNYHAQIPPVCSTILSQPDNVVHGLLGPGQNCTLTGFEEYEQVSHQFHIPVVITGFEPVDVLEGILKCISMLESGKVGVENQYKRAVKKVGNPESRALINEVFEPAQREWRGIGAVPLGGYQLKPQFASFDALSLFTPPACALIEPNNCISEQIWRGMKKPTDCPSFGKSCKPDSPLGASMVSSLGTCSAYLKYMKERAI